MHGEERNGADRPIDTAPGVLGWRMFKVEEAVDHVETRLGHVEVAMGRHGERMDGLRGELSDIKTTGGETRAAVQRLEDQRFNNLWHLVLATATVIGTVIGSHFLIK